MIEESVFGRIVNPISTRRGGGADYFHYSTTRMRISEKDLTKDAFVQRA